ncbi:MAG TPA: hypothetical protein VN885_08870 [Candidatus Acidoferrales bacterium]|nr:hypothetical protein [Candidatus Acidoferrales bacterium]
MRPRRVLLVMAALLIWRVGAEIPSIWAQSRPTVQQLFRELQSNRTSDHAEAQLRELGSTGVHARRFLALHLPALIETDPRTTEEERDRGQPIRLTWRNEVRLAGELKIVEAAPGLAKWITVSTSGGMALGIGEEALVDSPAGQALVQIGDPDSMTCRWVRAGGRMLSGGT